MTETCLPSAVCVTAEIFGALTQPFDTSILCGYKPDNEITYLGDTPRLRIIGCCDKRLWYANLVGQTVPYLGRWRDGYKSREPDGYINLVRFEDAEVVQ